jgi:3',5'-cyclic-AMP phosphodiesterase
MTRRDSLLTLAAASVAPANFSFVHFTDPHIQPELRAANGCRACFQKIQQLNPDFVLSGGDLVFDANETSTTKAKDLFRLYRETLRQIEAPVHTVPGNHDVIGLSNKSDIPSTDPLYGKKYFEDIIGKRYSSFNHKGWHFILLDSIGATANRGFIGLIDDEQLQWLQADLKRTGTTTPTVILTHIPLVSAVLQIVPDPWKTSETYLVTNASKVLDLLQPYNIKAVLQGHTHIRETVIYNNTQFITSGAVSGNWWKGSRLGHPEGFGVLTVNGNDISWRYESYGFKAV